MAYAFRFYGRAPAHWHEGAALGHAYEVQFSRPLSRDERAKLADLYERTLQAGAAEPSPEAWLWSDARFALFYVGERFVSAARMVFARVTDFLMEAQAICSIQDVVYLNAAAPGASRWDRWSVRTQPLPDPGPQYPMKLDATVLLYPRDRTGDLPAAAADEDFESARAAARSSLVRERAAATGEAGGLRLEAVDARPAPTDWPDDVRARFDLYDPRDLPRTGPRPCAYARNDRGDVTGFVYLDDEGERRPVTLPVPQYPRPIITVHPDGSRGLCAVHCAVFEIDFSSGEASERWQAPPEKNGIQGLGYLADGELWAVKSHTMLYVVDPTGGGASGQGPTPIVSAKSKGTCLEIGRQGTILFTSEWGKKPQIFGFSEAKLKKLATFKLTLAFQETDGVIYLFFGDDTFRLDNVDDTYEAFAAAQRKRADKARLAALGIKPKRRPRKAAAKAAKPALSIQWGTAEFPPEIPRAHEKTEATAAHAASGANAVYECVRQPADPRRGFERIRWTDGTGGEVALDLTTGRDLCFTPDGSMLAVATQAALYRLERGGVLTEVLPAGKGEFFRQVLTLGDHLLALTNKRLYLLDPAAQGDDVVIGKLGATHGFQVRPIPGRDAVTITREHKGLDVVRVTKDKLKKLGKIDEPLREVAWKDGVLHVWDDLGGRAGVVDNVVALADA